MACSEVVQWRRMIKKEVVLNKDRIIGTIGGHQENGKQPDKMTEDYEKSMLKSMEVHFPKGKVIFREEERSRDLYILLSGKVIIRKNGKTIGTVDTPDTYLGEMSTLLGSLRTATMIAATDCNMIRVPENKVLDFFQFSPSLGMKLAKTLAQRLREMNSKYERLLRETVVK